MKPWQKNIPLKQYTTLKVGGPTEYFVAVDSEAALRAAIKEAKTKNMPFRVIGGGSNILVPDEGLPGLTIKNNLRGFVVTQNGTAVSLTVGAGEVFDEVVARSVDRGYWGLENLSHIPGSIGATPVQNVGAYGVEVADLITEVRVYDTQNDSFHSLSAALCVFSYRDSVFKTAAGKRFVIVAVTVLLSTESRPRLTYKDLKERLSREDSVPSLQDIRKAVIEIRSRKFPDWRTVGTAGSFFKNPVISTEHFERLRRSFPELPGFPQAVGVVKVPLGWILEHVCHLRGVSEGAVGAYEGQALVLVATPGARAADIEAFANQIADTVQTHTDIHIEWEVTKLT